jgi:SAM-dependent methyltransferase
MNPLIRYAVAVAVATYLLLQARKPNRWVGRLFLHAMNKGHSRLTDWGLTHVTVEKHFTTLDVGCGGGRTVAKLAAMAPDGIAHGIDIAEGSVAASRVHNAHLTRAGCVVIEKASVSQLPFPDGKFDLATAVETQYYWPDLPGDMREILRVLKPGGQLIVIAEMYKGGRFDRLKWPVMWLLRSSHLSANDHRELFLKAGYTDVEIVEEPKKGWICAIGRKPGAV